MNSTTRSWPVIATVLAVLVLAPASTLVAVHGDKLQTLAVAAPIAMVVGGYLGLRHPMLLFYGLAVVVGFLPFGVFPGAPLPLYLVFAASVVLAVIVHPSENRRLHTFEVVLIAFVAISALSVVFTAVSMSDYVVYVKWAIVTLAVVALLRLSDENLHRVGVVFVYSAAFNAVAGMIIFVAPSVPVRKLFSPFGYGIVDASTRYVYNSEGVEQSARLGGMWVEPNAAGIGLTVGLCVAMVVIRGWQRWAFAALFVVAITLTLSRAAIAGVGVAIVLALLFHRMNERLRLAVTGIMLLGVLAAAAVPTVRNRLLQSFVGTDVSSTARQDALRNFPHQLSGHWLFGLGWARPEFKDGALAFQVNYVANAPLLTVYRGGVLAGLAFVAVLIAGMVISWRAITSDSLPSALFGGTFIAFCFIALQLDHPVVATLPVTVTFSILLAFLVHADRIRVTALPDRPHALVPRAPVPA